MPNQRDVALRAGVSSASVSRYLHDPQSIKPAFRQKIQAAIEELSYQIDYSAQTLRTGQYHHIGILSPSIGPFHWEIFYAAQLALSEAGYSSSQFFTRDVDTLEHSFRNQVPPFLRKRHLDGVLFFPLLTGEDDALIRQLSDWGRPVVLLDRHFPEGTAPLPTLDFDNYHGGREAARELLEHGHREFLFLWGARDSSAAHERFRGFSAALAEAGIALGPDRQLDGEFRALRSYQNAAKGFAALPPFSAVFACNDSSALGFLKAMADRGVRCPADFSIIGYDDNIEFSPFLSPPLSSLRPPIREFGRAAAMLLLDLIKGTGTKTAARAFRPELVRRESVRRLEHS